MSKQSQVQWRKHDISILLGNLVDHFDSAAYGFLAPLLAPLFFPHHSPAAQLILIYSLLATSIITRPVGAFIFGRLAAQYGPLYSLSYSLIGVAIAAVALGFLPTYENIGFFAPLLLLVLRMLKGIFAAGESTVAKLYIVENKAPQQAHKASGYYQSSTMLGIILASVCATWAVAMPEIPWVWRVCFWMSGSAGVLGYVLRYQAEQTNVFQNPVFDVYRWQQLRTLWTHRVHVAQVAIVTGFSHITYALPFVLMNSFVPLISDITLEQMMVLNSALLVLDLFFIPVISHCTARYSPHVLMIVSAFVLSITVMPLFYGLTQASLAYVTFVRVWIVFWGVVFMCPISLWYHQCFTLPDRYFLVGMGNALGTALFGRMTTAISLGVWYATGGLAYAAAGYAAVMMLCTIWVVISSRQP